ncbi:MAG: transketolase [Verrucomicrobia bacterium]|nr:transketolase [Verrucomicrobiota bacterium]MBS0646389.1 transketolase [Verrucomicrobiota bacterium]
MDQDCRCSALQHLCQELRYQIIRMSHLGEAPHLGSSLSCIDLITCAYETFLQISAQSPDDPLRDRFFLSKGHAVTALYAVLAHKGFFSKKLLETFNQDGSCLPEHPTPKCVPGVEIATGSLGHGLSLGIGHALSAKIQGHAYRVMVLMSDGECNEGSVWEAALFAPAQRLDNLIAIIDFNKWQATGRSEQIMQLSPLKEKWMSFGWQTYEIDGNSVEDILALLNNLPIGQGKPIMIIAHTVKGKGISFMEDNNNWHYRIPTAAELDQAKQELGLTT